MVPLIATKSYPYAGRHLTQGDRFEAVTPQDADLLKITGLATDPPLSLTSRLIRTRDLSAEAPAVSSKPKRRYQRRDLVADP